MTLRGRVVHVDHDAIWLARGASLLVSRNSGQSWRAAGQLPMGPVERLYTASRLGRRLMRGGIHHFLPDSGIAFAGRHIFRRTGTSAPFRRVGSIAGSRPLVIATDGEITCYGEYRGNPERSPVHVFASRDAGETWEPVHEFRDVRHIHGIHHDPFTGAFWITTGDDDHEARIWVTRDRFRTVDDVVGGSQQTRAIQLLFTREYVYFGSDTPRAPNHIHRLDRRTCELEVLQRVGSSVFYGCGVGHHLFFATAAEPSTVNRSDRVEIWHSANGMDWKLVRMLRTDGWPNRLFQYGQVLFPAGPGDGTRLYYTPRGAMGDGNTVVVPVAELHPEPDRTGY